MLQKRKKGVAVQQKQLDITLVTPTAAMSAEAYGGRAKCLQRLVRLDLPVPQTCLLYTSPSPRDVEESRMPSSA